MSDTLKSKDWHYIYSERLGIMCADGKPTPEQVERARMEADEYESAAINPRLDMEHPNS